MHKKDNTYDRKYVRYSFFKEQGGFKKGRSCMDQLFTVRHLSKKMIREEQEDGGSMCGFGKDLQHAGWEEISCGKS